MDIIYKPGDRVKVIRNLDTSFRHPYAIVSEILVFGLLVLDFGNGTSGIFDENDVELVAPMFKFRGKRFDNGEWVYGDLLQIAGGCLIYFGSKTETGPDIPKESDIAVGLTMEEIAVVAPATVGQFTGLYDKNGEEIFAGDIIQTDYIARLSGKRHIGKPIVVSWCHQEARFAGWDGYTHVGLPIINRTVVIGNVFDNPRLINNYH